jgi:uncharacterized protein YkwD
MKFSILKLRITLFFAVLVLFVSLFSNRITLAKSSSIVSSEFTKNDLPAEFVYATNLSGIAKDVFQKINYQRKLKNLQHLIWQKTLAEIAYDYSKQMAEENFFDHFDYDGNSIVERADDKGLNNWKKIGENLFQSEGYKNPTDIAVNGWLKSRSHRENIYDKDWTHTGIGVYQTRDGKTYITQVFLKK